MSYQSYSCFTRRQCGLLYKWFKRGELTPPKGANGRAKKPGFVYRYEGQGRYEGFFLTADEWLFNIQLIALNHTIDLMLDGDTERAQAVLDGTDEWFALHYLDGHGIDRRKMWRAV